MRDRFCVDTNIVVRLERQMPRDVFPGPWEAVEELIAENRAFMPHEAYVELLKVDDVCAPWANSMSNFVVETTAADIQIVAEITQAHPGWVSESINAADPYLVAHAKNRKLVILTEERGKGPGVIDSRLKIPNVATEHGVVCLNFNDLARQEGWRFHRS